MAFETHVNKLPSEVKNSRSVAMFKKHIVTMLSSTNLTLDSRKEPVFYNQSTTTTSGRATHHTSLVIPLPCGPERLNFKYPSK